MKHMMRPTILERSMWLCALIACGLFQEGLLANESEIRPNILFLLVDDQRNDTLGCAGHPILQTPAIDRLASEGLRFENAFVTTSICAASRASIFTGLHERTHGYTFNKPPLRREHMLASYPALLRKSGYRTGFIGKYGVETEGKPESMMFHVFRTHGRNPYLKQLPDGSLRHETEIAADRAIEFLAGNPKGQPFCLSVSFNAVHAEDGDHEDHYPWPKSVDNMYENAEIPAPRLSDPAVFAGHPDFLRKSMNRQRYHWRWDTPEKYEKNMKAYFRMISGVDHEIGRICDALERLGFSENTVIIYMGDNGYYMGERGFAGKWTHYDESLRVPLIVYDPRLPLEERGKVMDQMVLNIDAPATMLELAGVEVPKSYQGRSLLSFVAGEPVPDWRTYFFCEHLMEHAALPQWEGIRDERFVYARYFGQNPVYEFLHDLKTDPDQLVNLASNPEYREVLSRMQKRVHALKTAYAETQ